MLPLPYVFFYGHHLYENVSILISYQFFLIISFNIYLCITKIHQTFHIDDNPPCFSTTSIAIQVNPHHNTTLLLHFTQITNNPKNIKTYHKSKINCCSNKGKKPNLFRHGTKEQCYMICFWSRQHNNTYK